jgi:hypothetical protein
VPGTYTGPTAISNGILSITSPWLPIGADVSIATPGQLNLNFTGTNSVNKFFIDGVVQASGVYSNANCSAITGSGCLRARAGKGEGFYMIVK